MFKSRRQFRQIVIMIPQNDNVVFHQTHQIVTFDRNEFFLFVISQVSLPTITFEVRLITLCISTIHAVHDHEGIEKHKGERGRIHFPLEWIKNWFASIWLFNGIFDAKKNASTREILCLWNGSKNKNTAFSFQQHSTALRYLLFIKTSWYFIARYDYAYNELEWKWWNENHCSHRQLLLSKSLVAWYALHLTHKKTRNKTNSVYYYFNIQQWICLFFFWCLFVSTQKKTVRNC